MDVVQVVNVCGVLRLWFFLWPELANLPGVTVRIGPAIQLHSAQVRACGGSKNHVKLLHGTKPIHPAGRLVSTRTWRFLETNASITVFATSSAIGHGSQCIVLEDPQRRFWFFLQIATGRVIDILPRSVEFIRHSHHHHTCQLRICK